MDKFYITDHINASLFWCRKDYKDSMTEERKRYFNGMIVAYENMLKVINTNGVEND